jgi:choline dehydrogenase-like flavoprotein
MAVQQIYDAIIVGSGATGGRVAKELAETGIIHQKVVSNSIG